jgi:SdrD B-like domain
MFQDSRQERAAHNRIAPMIVCTMALAAFVAIARPAAAQDSCPEGSILCGTVWSDTNGNGVQDAGEGGLEGVKVQLYNGTDIVAETYTDSNGAYSFDSNQFPPGTYSVIVTPQTGTNLQPSPTDAAGSTDSTDSDGVNNTAGSSVYMPLEIVDTQTVFNLDFGFTPTGAKNPGTGTPGYWKNHPEAWPSSFDSFYVGGKLYTKAQAIYWLGKVGKDKTTTMFSSLVPAMLNVAIGNDSSCVATTISDADAWMAKYGPVGSGVWASTAAWSVEGEPLHTFLDSYNNGHECAPHRN